MATTILLHDECYAVVDHERGERLIYCLSHHAQFVVKAKETKTVVYSVSPLQPELFSRDIPTLTPNLNLTSENPTTETENGPPISQSPTQTAPDEEE
jgi:hypothetical protein